MSTTQMPWASGKRKPAPGRKRTKGSKRRRNRTLLSVLLSIVTLALLGVGLVTESLLYYLVSATFGLAVVAQRRAMKMEMRMADRRRGTVVPPKPKKARPGPPTADRAKKMREEAEAARTAGGAAAGPVKCTATKKPTAECDCASRHITTRKKAEQFGRPIGSPYGHRKKQAAS